MKRKHLTGGLAGIIVLLWLTAVPLPSFKAPCSTVVEASDGSLLGARIASDGQWRFPPSDSVPYKFEKAILAFEDRYFYYHPGINPVSLARAFTGNIREGRIVSGGSTLTMQVARLAAGNTERTYSAKAGEILAALKLELLRSKKRILLMYVSNAPFGGNTVGLEAAAWRYTGKAPQDLSWAEASALAVLPNSPGLVFPGKNDKTLKDKRDRLLTLLFERGIIDSLTCSLSIEEPVPGEPEALPSLAPHLTDYFFSHRRGERIRTTVDPDLQRKASLIINTHQQELNGNLIFNSACIIAETGSGKVLAYVGNSSGPQAMNHGGDVDLIRSPRSTGSILKPLLYAAMQQSGDLLPDALVADIPTRFPGFSPKNADKGYRGAIPAGQALSQSLNIPAVRMLRQYGSARFLGLLRDAGFSGFNKDVTHYGLSLILGGAETTLWDLASVYSSLSRILNRYLSEERYSAGDIHPLTLEDNREKRSIKYSDTAPLLSASSIWLTYRALLKGNRPDSETGWQYFASSPNVAWKTGTSYGYRDSWAVGTTPGYVTAVWAGNAGGEGRPGITGLTAAAPVLFDLVRLLPASEWFSTPAQELTTIKVCRQSGFKAGPDCPETEETEACNAGLKSEACPYHKIIHLDREEKYRVNPGCVSQSEMVSKAWFILPPAMEYYYRLKNPSYKSLPPLSPLCGDDNTGPVMEFIYPVPGIKIFIPRDQHGDKTRITAELAHRDAAARVFWHLDRDYLATTRYLHSYEIIAGKGEHTLTAVDEKGNTLSCRFEILE